MIFSEWKPLDEIVRQLNGRKKVLLVGCATCVAECAAGGEREVETLAPLLSLAFREQGQQIEIATCTLEKQCEWEFVEELSGKLTGVDALLSLACGIGVQALAERFPELPVYPGVNTSALDHPRRSRHMGVPVCRLRRLRARRDLRLLPHGQVRQEPDERPLWRDPRKRKMRDQRNAGLRVEPDRRTRRAEG